MKNSTEKQIQHQSYWVDYPFDDVVARFDGETEKFFFKLYGKKEKSLDLNDETQVDFVMNAIRYGDEITEKEYSTK